MPLFLTLLTPAAGPAAKFFFAKHFFRLTHGQKVSIIAYHETKNRVLQARSGNARAGQPWPGDRRQPVCCQPGRSDALATDRPASRQDAHPLCACSAGAGGASMDPQLEAGQGTSSDARRGVAGGTAHRGWARGRHAAPAPDGSTIPTKLRALTVAASRMKARSLADDWPSHRR